MNDRAMAYMKAKGSSQGAFADDSSRAGKGRSLCLSVGFKGEVPHDVRGGKHATTRHDPISIVHAWSPATVQFLTALWANETLDEVDIAFIRPDGTGKEEEYATLTLTKATVAYVDLRSGETAKLAEGEYRALCDVGLHAEKIEFKLKGDSGPLVATYDRAKQS
ncbi:MAG TPA: type VI secretion system tube protein Hcp [Polyangiaceae bacterium]|jgi:type VI secretion system Hcp family effector